jgi:hypothetical protein
MTDQRDANLFKEWCTGYSGCDGGDLGSPESPSAWVCGIEWGGGQTPKSLLSNISEDVRTPPQGYDNWQDNLSYIFNWQTMKLLSAIDGGSVKDYKEFSERVMPFVRGGCGYFKMNLHPIGFKDTSHGRWLGEFASITGFATKSDYLAWSTDYRLPQIRKWAENSKPKLILCLGKTYLPQFKRAFLDDDSIINQEIIEGKEMFWGANLQGSLVVVVPFMVNRNGLTRNVAIQSFGERIKDLLTRQSTRTLRDKAAQRL